MTGAIPKNRVKDCWSLLIDGEVFCHATPLACAVEEAKRERQDRASECWVTILPMEPNQ